jgi:hypothetical protein
MLKMKIIQQNPDGPDRPVWIFGLSEENMRLLLEEKPIVLDLEQLRGPPGLICLAGGKTEQAIIEQLTRSDPEMKAAVEKACASAAEGGSGEAVFNATKAKIEGVVNEDPTRPGPTGRPPRPGALPGDFGELRATMRIEKGLVVMDFGVSTRWLSMTAEQARAYASGLRSAANRLEALNALVPDAQKN